MQKKWGHTGLLKWQQYIKLCIYDVLWSNLDMISHVYVSIPSPPSIYKDILMFKKAQAVGSSVKQGTEYGLQESENSGMMVGQIESRNGIA